MGQLGCLFPRTPPECLPNLLVLSGHSVNVGLVMDHLPQRYLHFPFISNWQMKGFVLLLKEFQAFAPSGGGGYFGPKGDGPRPLSS